MNSSEQTPENSGERDFSQLKEGLRGYYFSKYIPQDGVRKPIHLKDCPDWERGFREGKLTAIEHGDINGLEAIRKDLDVWFNYINEKDRAEGATIKKLHDELETWIDSILAQ